MHTHTYSYPHIHTLIHIYTHAHTNSHIHTHMHTYTHILIPTHTYIDSYTFTHTNTLTHRLIHTCTHIHTHIRSHTHTHSHLKEVCQHEENLLGLKGQKDTMKRPGARRVPLAGSKWRVCHKTCLSFTEKERMTQQNQEPRGQSQEEE